jgi:hypothetical protein
MVSGLALVWQEIPSSHSAYARWDLGIKRNSPSAIFADECGLWIRTLGLNGGPTKILAATAQLLAYMLDICLLYLESNDGNDAGAVIPNNYGLAIDALLAEM